MPDVAAKYVGAFSLGLRGALEYRVNFLVSLLGAVSPLVIQTALWSRLYAPGGHDRLFGFTYVEMLGYVVVANIVGRLVRTGFEYELNEDIRSGGLDRFLVKPIDYFGLRAAQFLGAKAAELSFQCLILAGAVVILQTATEFSVSVGSVLGFVAALALGLVLNFLVFWCVGLLGFWLTEIGFLFEAVRIVLLTASGGIFPLSVLGPRAEGVFLALPFRFTVQFPTDVLCGRVPPGAVLTGLGLALGWCVVLALVGRALWTVGLRRFVAVGG